MYYQSYYRVLATQYQSPSYWVSHDGATPATIDNMPGATKRIYSRGATQWSCTSGEQNGLVLQPEATDLMIATYSYLESRTQIEPPISILGQYLADMNVFKGIT